MPGVPPIRNATDASQALEATLLRQLLTSSGAFKGSQIPGESLHNEMFIEVLADAVAHGGGMGLAKLLEGSLDHGAAPAEGPPAATTNALPAASGAAPPAATRVTSGFGERTDPLDGTHKFHTGMDLAAPEGAPIRAAADGIVRRAGDRGGYGNAIEIDHGDGVSTLYAHASSVSVQPGDHIARGAQLGEVGQTGRATGPHLHFEVRLEGKPIDPTAALKAYGIRADNLTRGNR
jgi:murein DD-endopeptidase MepM/ murein hydrolase activator NlpD